MIKDESHETPDFDPWTLPTQRRQANSVDQDCAEKLAHHIAAVLCSQEVLPSTRKPIQPRDILILVRQRSEFLNHLIRQLKKLNVAVAGADRLILTNHIAIQDLISLGQFLLQPKDDLSLANVLTSPLIGLTQDHLMALSLNRQGSLWSALIHQGHTPIYASAYTWLKAIMDQTDYLSPVDLYAFILYQQDGKRRILGRLGSEAEDILATFMEVLATFDRTLPPSLELVIGELMAQDFELKRDSADTLHNQIRLMTIHGAKGLQAPVVILVEKFSTKSPNESVLWSTDKHNPLLLARPSKVEDTDLTRQLKQAQEFADDAEDKRLLYVALTRPQDHLYVCGYGTKIDDNSWYKLLENQGTGFLEWRTGSAFLPGSAAQNILPAYLNQPADLKAVAAPLEEKEKPNELAHRGIIIHKLLEVLPDLPQDQWACASPRIAAALTTDKSLIDECGTTAIEVLNRPDLEPFFGKNSVAEFEVMTQDGKFYRLDRIVLGDAIKILDYKSSLTPPDKVPESIRNQLQTYRDCLTVLYPNTPIECYVLWTTTGRLDAV